MKYLHHIIAPRTSAILTSSDSVELPTFSLCLREIFTIAPLPMDIIAPVCPFESQWTPYEPSTHHIKLVKFSALKCLFVYLVDFRYLMQCLSFFQSSISGFLTLVVKNDTAVWISGLALRHRNSNWAVVR